MKITKISNNKDTLTVSVRMQAFHKIKIFEACTRETILAHAIENKWILPEQVGETHGSRVNNKAEDVDALYTINKKQLNITKPPAVSIVNKRVTKKTGVKQNEPRTEQKKPH